MSTPAIINVPFVTPPLVAVTLQSGVQGPPGPSGGGAGTSDHGALTGLGDDDHTQYHTNARGDARYAPIAHTHTTLVSVDITTLRIDIGGGQFVRIVAGVESGKPTLKLALE